MSRPAPAAVLDRLPPQALFILGAASQYVGAALAVLLFERVPAAGVGWLRVAGSAAVLVAWRKPWRTHWTPRRLRLVAAFGLTLAFMNVAFYLAIDRLALGTTVAIEFCGPIAVAALGSRTRRDAAALGLATVGVLALADVHLEGSPVGLALAVAAGAAWAGYIVLGHRVAADAGIRRQDGLALGMAIGAVGFAPVLAGSAVPAVVHPLLLAACLAVGVASSVVPYGIDQVAMRRLPKAHFALLLALLPATATIVGAALLGQVPGVVEASGITLVVVACALRSHRPN
ncbi:MAG TPA: EamA family transporter [Solirubrobacteraceae bacterium]|jgi:inner membrane transporter RhtA